MYDLGVSYLIYFVFLWRTCEVLFLVLFKIIRLFLKNLDNYLNTWLVYTVTSVFTLLYSLAYGRDSCRPVYSFFSYIMSFLCLLFSFWSVLSFTSYIYAGHTGNDTCLLYPYIEMVFCSNHFHFAFMFLIEEYT